jgi:Fur family transcriptional regulator, stress-responsive regulator
MSQHSTDSTALLLREQGLRVTPQRRAIWGVFATAEGAHLSADEVFQRARRELPELSRATVYNALGELVSAGLLGLVEGPGPQLYDANIEPHHHFRCLRCRRLYDVEPAGVESLRLAKRGFRVERAQVLLEGTCPSCSRPAASDHRPSRRTRPRTPSSG